MRSEWRMRMEMVAAAGGGVSSGKTYAKVELIILVWSWSFSQ